MKNYKSIKINTMERKMQEYALKQLKMIENDNDDVTFHKTLSNKSNIYAEFRCGRNIMLSEEEVKYQAIEYLKNEIELIKQS